MNRNFTRNLMAENTGDTEIEKTFLAAEQAGLRLAIKGRLIALLLVGLWLVPTRGADRALDIVIALIALAILGLLHFVIVGSPRDRVWVKYVFLTIDILLLSVAVALLPPEPDLAVPQIFMFRFDVFHYYYIVLGVAAFSFSPGLVLWAGAAGACGWLGAFAWVRAGVENPLDWQDALRDSTSESFIATILDADFVASGSRLQEAFIYFVVSVLIAIVMFRARATVRRQIEAERDKASVSQMFGRFVPEAVANSMIQDRGILDPVEREATVLFADIAGFTSLTEARGPQRTVEILNAYFDRATEIISRHDGVVTQFQGDAILAVFNVPTTNAAHARCALRAAREILGAVAGEPFGGERLRVRIGLNSGPLVAGNVGGGGRQSYTVHGDTVNLAARLESLNKEYATSILVSRSTQSLLQDESLEKVGEASVQGVNGLVTIYTVQAAPPDGA